jgi:rubrerythrin
VAMIQANLERGAKDLPPSDCAMCGGTGGGPDAPTRCPKCRR